MTVDTLHVYPVEDLFDHDIRDGSTACVCGPKLSIPCPMCGGDAQPGCAAKCEDGWMDTGLDRIHASLYPVMVVHHSMDGREANEENP